MARRKLGSKRLAMGGATFLPIMALLVWTLVRLVILGAGAEVVLPIEGYDPRDLLSGHYLQYRVQYGADPCVKQPAEACVCFAGPGRSPKVEAAGACSEIDQCPLLIRGRCDRGRFVAGVERYYFPEEHREKLVVVPPKASVILRVRDGQAAIKGLEVEGQSLKQWLRNH